MKRIFPYVTAIVLLLFSFFSFLQYQNYSEVKSELYRKELLIFKNHVTGTVRAMEAGDKDLMEETLFRLSSMETFHSPSIDFPIESQLLLAAYEQGIRNLLMADPADYKKLTEEVETIFDTLVAFKNSPMDENDFKKRVQKLLPKAEAFRDKAERLQPEN